jgi:hypothetical protein
VLEVLVELEALGEKGIMKNPIQRCRLFFVTGVISGLGLGLFVVEVFRQQKRPAFYLGSIALTMIGTILYRHFSKSETSLPDQRIKTE